MRKRLLPLFPLCLFLFFSAGVFAVDINIVTVGAFDDYPLIFQDTDGEIKGLYVDLLTEIGKKENIIFTYAFGTWQDGLDWIHVGKVDLLTDVAFTEERSKYLDYCTNPLFTFWGELYVLESSDIDGLLQLPGKRIGVLKGDIFYTNFLELIHQFSIECEIVEYDSYEQIFIALAQESVDGGIAAGSFKKSEQKKYSVKSTGFVFSPLDVYFVTAKNENSSLRQVLDTYLGEWKSRSDSVFNDAKEIWLYGNNNAVAKLPPWLINVIIILTLILAAAFFFIIILKIQVKAITQKIRLREKSLHDSELQFRTMIETLPLAIHLTGENGAVTEYVNPAMVQLFGYTKEDIPSMDEWLSLAFSDGNRREKQSVELDFTCKDGTIKQVSWGFIDMGEKKYSYGLDLTARKLAEEKTFSLLAEKDMLLKEVHHRIKNNMTTIKGLLAMQIDSESQVSVIQSLREAESRVQSMIILYDRLYCTDNYQELSVKDYLEPLVGEIIGSYKTANKTDFDIQLERHIDDFILNVRLLSPLGVIVNEILSNSLKHAFTGKEKGLISIWVSVEDTIVSVRIQDDGKGMPDSVAMEQTGGFGLQLAGMLAQQMHGNLRIESEAGTLFILEFHV